MALYKAISAGERTSATPKQQHTTHTRERTTQKRTARLFFGRMSPESLYDVTVVRVDMLMGNKEKKKGDPNKHIQTKRKRGRQDPQTREQGITNATPQDAHGETGQVTDQTYRYVWANRTPPPTAIAVHCTVTAE